MDLTREADFVLGGLSIRPSTRQVETPDGPLTLEPRIMQVLVALARRRNQVVSRDELLNVCWDGVIVGDDSIHRCISRLRKLGESTSAFRVETIPRVGYRLADVVAAPTGSSATTLPKRAIRPTFLIAIIATIAVLGVLAFIVLGTPRLPVDTSAPRLAVRSFEAIGDTPAVMETARLAPGTIADALQQVAETVLSSTVSGPLQDARRSDASATPGADYFVDGEVSGGDPLRLLLRLTSADGVIIWSEEFLGGQEERGSLLARAALRSVEAAQSLMQARADGIRTSAGQTAHMNSQKLAARGDALGAWRETKRVVAAEPDNAAALLSAAIAGGAVISDIPRAERAAVLTESRAYIERARIIDPKAKALPLAILATTPPAAIGYRLQILQDGIAATPAFTELRTALVEELAGAGRLTDAAWAARTAVQQDPVSRSAATGLVTTLVLSGRNEEAIDAADRALRLWPNYYPVVRARFEAALWAGKYDEAKRLYANPANTLLIQPMAATRPLEALMKALETRAPSDIADAATGCSDIVRLRASGVWYCMAAMSALDRRDEAFALIADAPRVTANTPAEHDSAFLESPHIVSPAVSARLFLASSTALREDPRIIEIFERFGLLDYWRTSGKWPDFCETEPKSVCAKMRDAG
jgi:DNA-binding winged helix-turn-helix (wHTH) protein/tetratricopeptide (TPR) repeat protein